MGAIIQRVFANLSEILCTTIKYVQFVEADGILVKVLIKLKYAERVCRDCRRIKQDSWHTLQECPNCGGVLNY